MTEPVTIGRNEPCPCGSGKKYKRCCGVNAAPKLVAPKEPASLPGGAPFSPEALEGFDPQMMLQFSQALQRLPKGQLQRLQAIMQKAMSGKDVTAEAQEFEKTLPMDFQNMIQSFSAMGASMGAMGGAMGGGGDASLIPDLGGASESKETPQMTEEEARALVAKAAEEGKISSEQAKNLLEAESPAGLEQDRTSEQNETQKESASKLGRFWRNLSGKSPGKNAGGGGDRGDQ